MNGRLQPVRKKLFLKKTPFSVFFNIFAERLVKNLKHFQGFVLFKFTVIKKLLVKKFKTD
jgi:hypothetical protein